MNQYLCKNGGIRTTSNWTGNRGSCKYDFELSLSSFDTTKITKLLNSPRKRTSSRDPNSPKFDLQWSW